MTRFPGRGIRVFALKKLGFSIGKNVYIGPGLTMTVGIADKKMILNIGDRVSVGPNVTFILASHPNESKLKKIIKSPKREISIGHDSWLGANCVIMPGVNIGEFCVVGTSAVVTKDVPSYTMVAGIPARVIKKIEPDSVQ